MFFLSLILSVDVLAHGFSQPIIMERCRYERFCALDVLPAPHLQNLEQLNIDVVIENISLALVIVLMRSVDAILTALDGDEARESSPFDKF